MKRNFIAYLAVPLLLGVAQEAYPCGDTIMNSVRDAYNRLGADTATTLGTTVQYLRHEVEKFYESLPPNSLVLDAGCGVGLEAEVGRSYGHEVMGLDFSLAMLEEFKKRNPGAVTVEGSLTAIPLDDNSVDVVFNTLSIIHLQREDGIKAIKEFARVTRNGGRVLIATSVADAEAWEEHADRDFLQARGIAPLYFYHWHKQSLFDTIRAAGIDFTDPTPIVLKPGRPSVVFVNGTVKK